MRITAMALVLALLALSGCQEDTPVGPTTQDLNQAREELVAKVKQGGQRKAPSPRPAAELEPQEESFATLEKGFHYERRGKRDPFRSFEWEQLKLELSDLNGRGPLEHFDIGQLELTGVIWNERNARALIADPSGMTYIVAEGAKVGKNEGRVIQIHDNLVVIKETYVDYLGEETTKDIEMRIRPTEGG
jgi:Tfp pilus assembly protein PilP